MKFKNNGISTVAIQRIQFGATIKINLGIVKTPLYHRLLTFELYMIPTSPMQKQQKRSMRTLKTI